MRLLTVCGHGQVRSVTLARILRKYGHEVLAVGWDPKRFSDSTIRMLVGWADRIYPLCDLSAARIRERALASADLGEATSGGAPAPDIRMDYAVGPDRWHLPDHPDLIHRLLAKVIANPPS